MAWNEPGKPGQDPWGNNSNNDQEPKKRPSPNRKKPSGDGPDLEEMLRKLQAFLGGSNNNFSGKGIFVVVAIAIILWLLSGIYIVNSPERGVVTRFGAFVEETNAGPHWHLPYPLESVVIVNVDRVRTAEIGYRANKNASGSVGAESLMLTKDENIVDLRIAVQYKIQSANQYLFDVADPNASLRAVTESALREVVGQNKMDFVLTQGRNEVVARVETLAQKTLDKYHTGLLITSVNLQDAQPPEQVQPAFADVVKAREDKERIINEADAYANGILPVARGKAARQYEESRAYHDKVIADAQGKASRFVSILTQYQKAPVVTRQRLYSDAITTVLTNTTKVFMGASNNNSLMYLPLDKMMGQHTTVPFKSPKASDANTSLNKAGTTTRVTKGTNIRDYLRTREIR